jgi:hypothetical protein
MQQMLLPPREQVKSAFLRYPWVLFIGGHQRHRQGAYVRQQPGCGPYQPNPTRHGLLCPSFAKISDSNLTIQDAMCQASELWVAATPMGQLPAYHPL